MHRYKKTNKLRLTAETVRILGQDHMFHVIGGLLESKSNCVTKDGNSEANSCSACHTALCSNRCDTTTSL